MDVRIHKGARSLTYAYTAALENLRFLLSRVLETERLLECPAFKELDLPILERVLEQGTRFSESVVAPLQSLGDEQPARLEAGRVVLPPAFVQAYRRFTADGWLGLDLPQRYGGQGMPRVLQAAFAETLNGACVAFGMLPVTQRAAARLLIEHARAAIVEEYVPGLVSGEHGATIAITEAQAGSDVGRVQCLAEPVAADRYRLRGSKIFISNGDQNYTEQILHMVLARMPDAPVGTRGLSLFLVPRLLTSPQGPRANGVRVLRLERKMGLHASPTCVMAFEDATAFPIGELGRGLSSMFTMVNTMRLEVAVQGVAVGAAALGRAAAYCLERAQGGASESPPVPLVRHADVRRMLLLMRARIEALRALTLEAALQLDLAEQAADEATRVEASRLAQWLLPVCKACATDAGSEVANLAVQLFGGHGYVHESGVEQLVRDGRIGSIYEGTNGIQALDLVQRKLCADGGMRYRQFATRIATDIVLCRADASLDEVRAALEDAAAILEHASRHVLGRAQQDDAQALRDVEAAATPYLRLTGLVGGAWMMLRGARAASGRSLADQAQRVTAAFYATWLLPEARCHLQQILAGSALLDRLPDEALAAGLGGGLGTRL